MNIRTLLAPVFPEEKWIRSGFALALIIVVGITFVAHQSIFNLKEFYGWLAHTHEVLTQLAEVDATRARLRDSWRTHISTGDTVALDRFNVASSELGERLDALAVSISDNPGQRERLISVRTAIGSELEILQQSMGRKRDGALQGNKQILAEVNAQRPGLRDINRLLEQMTNEEMSLREMRELESERGVTRVKAILTIGSLLSCIILAGSYWLLLKQIGLRQAANKELESFSYSVSHDLRSPLRAIIGYSEMLKEDNASNLDADGQKQLKIVRDEAARMNTLVEDLLAFSGLGRARMALKPIDMTELVREVTNSLGSPGKGDLPVALDTLPSIKADPGLIRQVWVNLIGNAIKYSSKREKPQVYISGKKLRGEVMYRIEDNGAGFDMQYADKLFGVFQRLHGTEEFSGSGIGLAIVHRIVSRHGGRVWADGQLDRGATFYFTLPA